MYFFLKFLTTLGDQEDTGGAATELETLSARSHIYYFEKFILRSLIDITQAGYILINNCIQHSG